MSYYQGDFYQGDPGFFSFLGGIAKKAAGFIPGVGPIASTALAKIPMGGMSKMARVSSAARSVGGRIAGAAAKHPVLTGAGAAGAIGVMGGAAGAAIKAHAMRAGMRRHRRMRVTNPKALRRAIRRTQGFAKLAMRTIHLVHPRKKARFGGFKKRTRKAA